MKQAIFGGLAVRLAGARVLDLFAGSGAGGIDALSRGAQACDFVERDAGAVATIAENLRRTGLTERGRVHRRDALRFLRQPRRAGARYDLVLLDPPYGDPAMLDALELLGAGTLLAPEAIVVAKHFWRDAPPDMVGLLHRQRTRRFGETALSFYAAAAGGEADR